MANSLNLRKTFTFQKCFRLHFLEFKIIWKTSGDLQSFNFIPEFFSPWLPSMNACQLVCTLSLAAYWQAGKQNKILSGFHHLTFVQFLKGGKKCFPRSIMTFYIQIFTLSEVFKCNILPQHEVTFDTSIGLTIHRKEGRKDASLHFTRTKLIYSKA